MAASVPGPGSAGGRCGGTVAGSGRRRHRGSGGVKAAIGLGAAGVWVGTRFLAAQEANIHADYLARVLASSGEDALYSEIFDVGWPNAPLRSLKNATTRNWEADGSPLAPNRPEKVRSWPNAPTEPEFRVTTLRHPHAKSSAMPARWRFTRVKPLAW